jgi:hypothetical protein
MSFGRREHLLSGAMETGSAECGSSESRLQPAWHILGCSTPGSSLDSSMLPPTTNTRRQTRSCDVHRVSEVKRLTMIQKKPKQEPAALWLPPWPTVVGHRSSVVAVYRSPGLSVLEMRIVQPVTPGTARRSLPDCAPDRSALGQNALPGAC